MEVCRVLIYCFIAGISWDYCESLRKSQELSSLCEAVNGIMQNTKFRKMPIIDIVSLSNSLKAEKAFDCMKLLITKYNFVFSSIDGFGELTTHFSDKRQKKDVIIILDSFQLLDVASQKMTVENYNYHGYFLIILTQNSTAELDSMFDLLWRRFIYNVNILAELNGSVDMFTFYPFKRNLTCHNSRAEKINSFANGTWSNRIFYPAKLRNFHKCPLNAAFYEYGPSAQQTVNANGSISVNGSDVEILKGLSKALNFDLKIEILSALGAWGQVWENGSSMGAFKSIIEKKIDVCGNFYYLTELRSRFMQFTHAYYSISMLMMIPRGAPLTALQTLVRPFQPITWLFFCAFLASGFIAVIVIRFWSRRTQLLFFDRNIDSPIMEMLVILFGGSQNILPQRNFSRLLLMSFAIVCFVFRSIYTGSLYKFLQSDGRKKDYQTIDELVDDGFGFYMDPGIEHMMEYTRFFQSKMPYNPNTFQDTQRQTIDSHFKGAVVSSIDEILHLNKLHHKNFTFNACNEVIMTVPVVFYLQKNSYLTEIFNEKIDHLRSAGMIDYWISKYLDSKYLQVKKKDQGPTKLNFKELLGAFQLFGLGSIGAFLVFIVELLIAYFWRRRRQKGSNHEYEF